MVDENLARIKRNQKKLVPIILALVVFFVLLILLTPNIVKSIFGEDCTCYISQARNAEFKAGFTCEVEDVINVVPGFFCYLTYLMIFGLFVAGLFTLKKTLLKMEKK